MENNQVQNHVIEKVNKLIIWVRSEFAPMLVKHRAFGVAFVVSVLAAFYWGLMASDRYVSEAHVIVQSTDLGGSTSVDFSGLFGDMGGGSGSDQLLLQNHLLSTDMLKKLDENLNLREHYSDTENDIISRMWSSDEPLELFHEYFLSRVQVEFDGDSGVLIIRAQAYDPEMAHVIATMLVAEGERHMNAMGHRLADAQVDFLEDQVAEMSQRVLQARKALLNFQNDKGMFSPEGTSENMAVIINGLMAKITDLQTSRSTLLSYQKKSSLKIREIDQQIKAIEKQIEEEKARLVSSQGGSLNLAVEEYQRLQLQAQFAEDIYKTAVLSLETGRIEATRTLKKVSILQLPTLPQYSMEPRRLYNTVVFVLVALILAGVVNLIVAIIHDHAS